MEGFFHVYLERHHQLRLDRRAGGAGAVGIENVPVSYTHLTLPTILRV